MSFAKLATILLIICITLHATVECKSMYGIGMRIIGDQLLLKDVREAPPAGLAEHPTIDFRYAIPEPITYIEIFADENVRAEVNFSYQNDLVNGTVTASNTNTTVATRVEPFMVLITIYGFNKTILNLNPSYVLNRDQEFTGILEPLPNDEEEEDDEEYLNLSDELFDETNNNSADDFNDAEDDNVAVPLEVAVDADFETADKIIEVGHRQRDDYMIYETYQTSHASTEEPTNHTVVFYYIDSNYITCAKFVLLDHFADKQVAADYVPPQGEYTHYSPNSLKAMITDPKTTWLIVKMTLYGYKPNDVPVAYVSFLPPPNSFRGNSGKIGATESPLSPMQRLKMLINAEPRTAVVRNTQQIAQPAAIAEAANGEFDKEFNLNQIAMNRSLEHNSAAVSMFASLSIVTLLLGASATFNTLW